MDGDEASELKTVLADPKCYTGRAMQGVKSKLDSLKGKVDEAVNRERQAVESTLLDKVKKLKAIDGFDKLPAECKTKLEQEVSQSVDYIKSHASIPVVREYEKKVYGDLLKRVDAKIQKATSASTDSSSSVVVPSRPTVSLNLVDTDYSSPWIASEDDVDIYVSSLKKALLETIKDGNRIQV